MIPATWEQQIDQIVREFSPDVISIKFNEGRDWYYDDPIVNSEFYFPMLSLSATTSYLLQGLFRAKSIKI